ncbi:MAG: FAD-dependent thymidylate synthase [Patescibacteria group bacterium]
MKVLVYDEFSPEDMAMLQALYSRSAASVTDHVLKVKQSGSGKFMEKYYVGYGHASIADCGSTTVFLEGVSMLAAKAVQDWPLYSGQETSSRYINMSRQPLIDLVNTAASQRILARWSEFYSSSQELVLAHLRATYPPASSDDPTVYERAVQARSFDVLRGFLPAGITTQLSWHTNLRQAADKLLVLREHPLDEISDLAAKIQAALAKRYAHSFSHRVDQLGDNYRRLIAERFTYFVASTKKFKAATTVKPKELAPYRVALARRPARTNLPHFLSELGQVTFDFPIDFGSFRDLQRHRHGVCRMPLLTANLGFADWYLEQLPRSLQITAQRLVKEQTLAIKKLKISPPEKQYYVAMGFRVSARVTYGLPAAVYVAELRSGRLVHPTLRTVAQQMSLFLSRRFPLLKLHSDLSADDWDIRRGRQTILEKK